MKIQIASDLHLDVNGTIQDIVRTGVIPPSILQTINKQDTVLVLAGDICNPIYFDGLFNILNPLWRHIIIVPGNHEFYGWWIEDAMDVMRDISSKYPNISFLDKQITKLDEITFIGATGWAPIKQMPTIERYINDFTWIKDFRESKNRCQDLHEDSIDWITDTLAKIQTPKILVTHFGQVSVPIPNRFIGCPVNTYFITGSLDKVKHKPELFIHGHTHVSYTIQRFSYEILCNPFGYGSENWQYSPNLVVTN